LNLSPGTRLGSYEIVAALGAGGMGKVYRARDVRLGREVAVKVMASRLAGDAEALSRFKREAQAVAALSHPNVLALFDYGESDGTVFAVSELLEGETLRIRLSSGALSQRKAVEIALQIVRGLAAAHERGITHRDLKPENVFLTRDGHVKILDFGLARLTETGLAIESEGPTLVRPTDPGRVMGTVGYMSPEQIRGEAADHRSDLFAFGAILYEMLAGRRAFRGESAVETMTATLREEPPELPASVPSALDRIVRHCLEKKTEERFRSAHDLAFDLEALADVSTAGSRGALPPVAKSGRPAAPLLLILLLVAAAAAGAVLARWLWRVPTPTPPVFRQLTFRRGTVLSARFAPNGNTIVYGAAWNGAPFQLFTTRTDRPESSPLALPYPADLLAVSRSGEIALSLGRRFRGSPYVSVGTLASAPLAGGTPREILPGVHHVDWAPDGSNLAVVRLGAGGGESRLEYPIGKALLRSANTIFDLRVSPGGERVAAFEGLAVGFRLVVFDRGGRRELALPLSGLPLGLAWHPASEEIWYSVREASGGAIRAVRLDGEQRLVHRSPGWTHLFDISDDGKVLLGDQFLRVGIAGLAPGETRERDLSWFEASIARDLSDDGRRLLFEEQGASGKGLGVYLRAMDGSPPIHLGADIARLLSPDGRWVLALTASSLVLLPTGVGEPKPLVKGSPMVSAACSWFPDGRRILCSGHESGNGSSRLYVLDLAGGRPRAVTPAGFGFSYATFAARPLSPDGRQTVAMAPDGKLWIYPLTDGVPRSVAGFEPGDDFLRWSGDGRALFLWRRDPGAPARVFRLDLATGRKEPWLEIRPPDPAGIFTYTSLVLTPDGKSYAYSYCRMLTDLYLAEGLR